MSIRKKVTELSLAQLKSQTPADLLKLAEELEVENASSMRKGDMMFAILKEMAEEGVEISGDGVLEVLQDGFGFLRANFTSHTLSKSMLFKLLRPTIILI